MNLINTRAVRLNFYNKKKKESIFILNACCVAFRNKDNVCIIRSVVFFVFPSDFSDLPGLRRCINFEPRRRNTSEPSYPRFFCLFCYISFFIHKKDKKKKYYLEQILKTRSVKSSPSGKIQTILSVSSTRRLKWREPNFILSKRLVSKISPDTSHNSFSSSRTLL